MEVIHSGRQTESQIKKKKRKQNYVNQLIYKMDLENKLWLPDGKVKEREILRV